MQSQADTAPRSEDPLGIPDVFGVLEKQLGLKLERIQSVPVEFIVVDSALKAPTPD
jgi:uncharacterized protein (TIGR03435 family)